MKRMGAGVIGYGRMGSQHAAVYARVGGAELIGVCDPDPARLEEARRNLEGSSPLLLTDDPGELLADERIEAVSICAPESLHRDPVERAIRAGRHVLLEKPLADSYAEALRIYRMARGYPKKFMVAHLLRFDSRYAEARRRIRAGDVGRVSYVRMRRSSVIAGPRRYAGTVQPEFHLAVHDIDLLHWLTGDRVERVYAVGRADVLSPLPTKDYVLSLLTCTGGVAAQMEHSWIMPELFPPKLDARAEIMGERGVLEIDLRNQGLSLFTSDRAEIVDTSYFVDGGAEERGAEEGGAEAGVAKVFPGMPSGSLVTRSGRSWPASRAARRSRCPPATRSRP